MMDGMCFQILSLVKVQLKIQKLKLILTNSIIVIQVEWNHKKSICGGCNLSQYKTLLDVHTPSCNKGGGGSKGLPPSLWFQ